MHFDNRRFPLSTTPLTEKKDDSLEPPRRKFTSITSLGSSLGWDTELPHYLLKYYAPLELRTEIRTKVRKTFGVESMFLSRKYWNSISSRTISILQITVYFQTKQHAQLRVEVT